MSGMPRALGMRMVSITKKRVVAEMRIKPVHINRSNRVNGGALMAFADVMGAAGTVANLPHGHRTGTLESKTNFFRAGEGPVMKAVSIPLHIGRTTMVWQTTIRNPDGKVAAIGPIQELLASEHPWVKSYFHGDRARIRAGAAH